ncbi:MAG: two-component system sensor histidine kinase NtrB [Hyalangium sp.]|uniref:two-component system sensor histidine kinase NtrB n=1 Tax=Hyalangium sp. TaxID=2028555 RepID=UPI00389A7DBA
MHASSSGMTGVGAPAPYGTPLRGRRFAWGQRLLNLFLRQDQRSSRPDELSRYRIVTIAALTQLPMSVLYLASMLSVPGTGFQRTLASVCIVAYGMTLVLVRTSSSPLYPSLLLCSMLTSAYISAGLYMGNPMAATHVAATLIPLLAFFLLGSRGGLIFSIIMGLYALVLQPLVMAKFDLWSSTVSGGQAITGNLFAALCIIGVWALSFTHSRARDKAQRALEQTLKELRDGEHKLSSVLESTDDIVCSIDPQGRLLTSNSAHRRWFSLIFGQAPRLGEPLAVPSFLERHPEFTQQFARALQGERVRIEAVYPQGDSSTAFEFSLNPITDEQGQIAGVTIYGRDVTARRQAEARLSELHRNLLETSRKAGMAEIATGVLHNVGNTLNSVNVSATLVVERLHGSRVPGLLRATELLRDKAPELDTFLTRDERGRVLPEYLLAVSRQLAEEQATMLAELKALTKNVDHIKSVVRMQQEHARFVGMVEQVTLPELLDDALRLHATSFEQLGIQVRREYSSSLPPLLVDRHKLLQILVNLLSNARHALLDSQRPDKRLTLRVALLPEEQVRIEVSDNGPGISPENLPRIFNQGFTTKKSGHGFGLHASALAATEMKGSLTCTSAGPGQGATFIIDLPLTPEQARA